MVPSSLLLLCLMQLLAKRTAGQLLDALLADPELGYENIPSQDVNVDPFKEYIPMQTDRQRKFLEGLVIEAGRHTLFPELYVENNRDTVDSSELNPLETEELPHGKRSIQFYEVPGQPEVDESYLNRKTRAGRVDCLEECPVYKPVCGGDGKIYPSECHMLKENCGLANVSTGPWERCRGRHYLCPSRCLDLSDPVCSSDGRIYHNICIMRKRNCGKILQVQPLKKCYEDFQKWKTGESCPEKCPDVYKPVCGSNGVIFYNECLMKMRTCRSGIFAVDMGNCAYVPKCPDVCLAFYDPACGSDGKLYINQCRMLQANCGKDVKKMPDSFCNKDGQGSLTLRPRPPVK